MKETDNDGSYETSSSLLPSPAFASSADGPSNVHVYLRLTGVLTHVVNPVGIT